MFIKYIIFGLGGAFSKNLSPFDSICFMLAFSKNSHSFEERDLGLKFGAKMVQTLIYRTSPFLIRSDHGKKSYKISKAKTFKKFALFCSHTPKKRDFFYAFSCFSVFLLWAFLFSLGEILIWNSRQIFCFLLSIEWAITLSFFYLSNEPLHYPIRLCLRKLQPFYEF